jgi:hypothetical protein
MVKNKNKIDISALLRENIKTSKLMLSKLERLEKDFKRAQLFDFIRFLIVAIPVVIAILYLIPLFHEILDFYRPIIDYIKQIRLNAF